MLVSPVPGVDRQHLIAELGEVDRGLQNVRGSNGAPRDRYNAYIRWATASATRLGRLVSQADLERLVQTRIFWSMLSMASLADVPAVWVPLDAEIERQLVLIAGSLDEVRATVDRWSRKGVFVVADTSVYIKHPEKFGEWDLREHAAALAEPIHLLVPIQVVDELDSLKESRTKPVRWRAGQSLAVMNRIFVGTSFSATLQPEDWSAYERGEEGNPRGALSAELLFDPPGHQRLPIADDEIIDRAAAVQALAGRQVTLLTYDTGMAMRARAAGLKDVRLDLPPEEDD